VILAQQYGKNKKKVLITSNMKPSNCEKKNCSKWFYVQQGAFVFGELLTAVGLRCKGL
jgi:hypothetical protein